MCKRHPSCFVGIVLIVISVTLTAQANAYPNAVGSVLDDVPSNPGHCGVCHYDFDGSGLKNPFGLAVEATDRSEAAILALGSLDSDGDGYSNDVEITDTITYGNTPTFPGLKASNVGGVINVALADIQTNLTPSSGSDTTPPVVTVIAPNGGETLTANAPTTVEWTATDTDGSGVASIDLYLSLDNGSSFSLVAQGLSNSGSYTWFPANRPSTEAIWIMHSIRVLTIAIQSSKSLRQRVAWSPRR
ncbi:MAG: Ig-like domain-containing protein [Planctomycetota bacterium]|jgi:hypothetical protein